MNYTEEPVVSQGANTTFRANERAFAVSPQACILAYAALESRIGTRSTDAAIAPESRTDLRPSVGAEPGSHPGMQLRLAYSSFSGAFTTSTGTWASRST